MDERFDDPSDEAEDGSTEQGSTEASSEPVAEGRDTVAAAEQQSNNQKTASTTTDESPTMGAEESDDEPLNIREDWDSATIYVEPEQSEDIEITFTRLKKQLKREDVTLEKNKHFYRGVFEVAFGEYGEETKKKIREFAEQDAKQ